MGQSKIATSSRFSTFKTAESSPETKKIKAVGPKLRAVFDNVEKEKKNKKEVEEEES